MVDLEIDALRARGIEVVAHLRESDELSGSRRALGEAATAPLRPAFAMRGMRALIRRVRPDVLHLHNPYPLVPPSIVRIAQGEGVPVVQSLHNVRHACPKTDFFRDGTRCTDCAGRRFPGPSVIHHCYRGSVPQSLLLASSMALHRGTFARVERFIAVSDSLRSELLLSRLPAERIVVVPNGIPDPGVPTELGKNLLFVGRLEREKGVERLLAIWRDVAGKTDRELVIAGSGPMEDDVRSAAAELPRLRYLGRLSPEGVQREMAGAAAMIAPSIVREAFGLTAVEAMAAGRPVIASSIGGLGEIVDETVGWPVGTDGALAHALVGLSDQEAARRGAAGRQRYLERFTIERSMDGLVEVFDSVAGLRSGSRATS